MQQGPPVLLNLPVAGMRNRAFMSKPALVVEDNEDIRESLVRLLATFHIEVRGASNGQEALQLLARMETPGVIVLDLSMPVMDGAEFRARQLADPALSEIPVILVSADAELREKADALNVSAAMRKPVDFPVLRAIVSRYCES